MDYYYKYLKYKNKFLELKGGTTPPKLQEIKKWCYHSTINFKNVIVKEWQKDEFPIKYYYSNDNSIIINKDIMIPRIINVTTDFNSNIYQDNYNFSKIINSGTYGIIIEYISSQGISISLKIMFSSETKDINNLIGNEIIITKSISSSECNIIDTYILNDYPENFSKYQDYIYYDNDSEIYMGIIIMPKSEGDCSELLVTLNHTEKLQLYKFIILQLYCLFNKHEKVYPDIKLSQVLYWNCPNGTYNYILADLGGIQNFNEYPIQTYGPTQNYLEYHYKSGNVNSINTFLFAVGALFHSIFDNSSKSKLDLSFNKIIYSQSVEEEGPSPTFKKLVEYSLADPIAQNPEYYYSEEARKEAIIIRQLRDYSKIMLIEPFKNYNSELVEIMLNNIIDLFK